MIRAARFYLVISPLCIRFPIKQAPWEKYLKYWSNEIHIKDSLNTAMKNIKKIILAFIILTLIVSSSLAIFVTYSFYLYFTRYDVPLESAYPISEEKFDSIEPEAGMVRVSSYNDSIDYFNLAKLVENELPVGYGENIAYDRINEKYYANQDLSNSMDTFRIYKFERTGNEIHNVTSKVVPYNNRWNSNSLSCFSCGCSCYVDTKIIGANDRIYFFLYSSNAKYNYLDDERQGLYFLKETKNGSKLINVTRWIRLTPKIKYGHFKIHDDGCSVAYFYEGKYNALDACEL